MALIVKNISEYATSDEQESCYVVKVQELKFLGITIFRKCFNSTNTEEISKFVQQKGNKIGFK